MIDAAYVVAVGESSWHVHVVGRNTYAGTNRALIAGVRVRTSLHRFITNAQNRGIDRNNTSGVKGVHYEAYTGRWRVDLWVNKKHLRLGRYTTLEEAERVVRQARIEHHGAFANDGKGLLQ